MSTIQTIECKRCGKMIYVFDNKVDKRLYLCPSCRQQYFKERWDKSVGKGNPIRKE